MAHFGQWYTCHEEQVLKEERAAFKEGLQLIQELATRGYNFQELWQYLSMASRNKRCVEFVEQLKSL